VPLRLVHSTATPIRLRQALRTAIAELRSSDVPSAELAAELLLMHVLGCDRAYLYTNPELELAPGVAQGYFALIAERASGKPTQYITGHQEFWGLDFEVTPDVLIPRPETEHLVETVLELVASGRVEIRGRRLRVVDVGTGSGCIAIALASELPEARICGIDLSWPALQVARRNATRLGFDDRVTLLQADLLGPFASSAAFDIVVSNPPYVGAEELDRVQREVREFEPPMAWGGTGRGDEIYARLFAQAREALRPGGHVVVEIGYTQSESVAAMLAVGWTRVDTRPDLAGIPRVVLAQKLG
jgi:release factor glutamine methyltransferase